MLCLITILKSLRTPDGVAQKFRVCVFGVSGCNVTGLLQTHVNPIKLETGLRPTSAGITYWVSKLLGFYSRIFQIKPKPERVRPQLTAVMQIRRVSDEALPRKNKVQLKTANTKS